ncbi:MAG: DinB family protein [Acidobacteriota bacterium]|nr:DinB family protein [Acidobacteriota bacterium]
MPEQPEPWLRGELPGVHPVLAPVLFALKQAREDLTKQTDGLSAEQIWLQPHDLGSVGFHLRHIAGSVDRLTAYLLGNELTEAQMLVLRTEKEPGAESDELLAAINHSLDRAETVVRSADPATFADPRYVGRKRLPTTVIGLIVHIAEHTQRHVGQAISAAKLARRLADVTSSK